MKILFVCTGNAYRSPIADALLKKISPKTEVDSAGTRAYHRNLDKTVEFLRREGASEYLKKAPEALDSKNLKEYNLIIAMELEHKESILDICPECNTRIVVWNIRDPYHFPDQTNIIFDQIKQKVYKLAKQLG